MLNWSPQDQEFEIGSVIAAKVVEIRPHGIMMELAPNVHTLLHISKISSGFVSLTKCCLHALLFYWVYIVTEVRGNACFTDG